MFGPRDADQDARDEAFIREKERMAREGREAGMIGRLAGDVARSHAGDEATLPATTVAPSAAVRGVTTQGVAEEFGVSARTVHSWVDMGCPCTRSTRGNRFDLGEVASWKTAHNITGEAGRPVSPHDAAMEAASLRKELALAGKYELALEREKGRLVDIHVAIAAGTAVITTIKGKFLGLAAAIAPTLENLTAAVIQTLLEKRLEEILNDLAAGLDGACEKMAGGIEARQQDQSQPVGPGPPVPAGGS